MEDSSEARYLDLIFCPPPYHHPSLTQAWTVRGHQHQVFLIKETVKHGSWALRHFLLPSHICLRLVCMHACLPAHRKRRQESQSIFRFNKKKKNNETNHGTSSTLNFPWSQPYPLTQYKLHISKKILSSQVSLPKLWPLLSWSKTQPMEPLGREQAHAAIQNTHDFPAPSKAHPSSDWIRFLAGIVSGFSELAAVIS